MDPGLSWLGLACPCRFAPPRGRPRTGNAHKVPPAKAGAKEPRISGIFPVSWRCYSQAKLGSHPSTKEKNANGYKSCAIQLSLDHERSGSQRIQRPGSWEPTFGTAQRSLKRGSLHSEAAHLTCYRLRRASSGSSIRLLCWRSHGIGHRCSFISQRHHRIDFRSASSGDVACQQGHDKK